MHFRPQESKPCWWQEFPVQRTIGWGVQPVKRARLFFRDLGAADAIADLPHRSASDLVDALRRFIEVYVPGVSIETLVPAMNQYADCYRRALRGEHHRRGFQPAGITGAVRCSMCKWTGGPLDHILSIRHAVHREAEATKERRKAGGR